MASKLHLSETQKGFLYIVLGALILLYAFNFFQEWLNTIVIVGGVLLIAYGFIKADGIEKVRRLISKKK